MGGRIELAPLSDGEMEALVAAAVRDAPAGAARRVREHAGGVPLFAVESLRMLADRGVMVAEARGSATARRRGPRSRCRRASRRSIAARLDALGDTRAPNPARRRGPRPAVQRRRGGRAGRHRRTPTPARCSTGWSPSSSCPSTPIRARPQRGPYGFVQGPVQRIALGTLSKRERKRAIWPRSISSSRARRTRTWPAMLAGHLMAAPRPIPTPR